MNDSLDDFIGSIIYLIEPILSCIVIITVLVVGVIFLYILVAPL